MNLMSTGSNYNNNNWFVIIASFLAFLSWLVFINWKDRSGRLPVTVLPRRPEAGRTVHDETLRDLLGVAPVQRVQPVSVQLAKIGFPASPVMPDLAVVDGVAPFNPDIVGKEWGAIVTSGGAAGETATSTYPTAASTSSKQITPFPKMVPIPTMVPSPRKTSTVPNKIYDEHALYANVPESISVKILTLSKEHARASTTR